MIRKRLNPDGTPNLDLTAFECDTCGTYTQVYTTCPDCGIWHFNKQLRQWLIPAIPGMRLYCPDCLNAIAGYYIDDATACPSCGSNDFAFWHDDLDDTHSAECRTCGTYTFGIDFPGSNNGWFTPPLEDR